MRMISKAALEDLRRRYTPGIRVELLHMELSDMYGEDLDIIPKRIGEYPKLKIIDEFDLE